MRAANVSVGQPGNNALRPQGQGNLLSTNVVNHLKEELLGTWETFLIPDYHRTVFLDCIYGLTPQQYSHIIVKEIEDL